MLTFQEGAVNCLIVLRKASASIFLVVMSLLIALHSPVFGYCPKEETFFIGHFHCQDSQGIDEHDCHCEHEEDPVPSPCDGEHVLISLDSDDFVWSGMEELNEVKLTLIEDLEFQSQIALGFPRILEVVTFQSRPPPPDDPVYRRFSVYRL